MNNPFSNSAVVVDRARIEAVHEMLVSAANAMLLSASLLTDRLDQHDGDPDLEDNNDREASDGDDRDVAWIEWTDLRGSQKGGPAIPQMHEDDEEDDPSGVHDEDGINTMQILALSGAAGCPIADPGGDEHDGREPTDGY